MHLISGTGYACAWHNNANDWPAILRNVVLIDSVWNAGDLALMGSVYGNQKYKIKFQLNHVHFTLKMWDRVPWNARSSGMNITCAPGHWHSTSSKVQKYIPPHSSFHSLTTSSFPFLRQNTTIVVREHMWFADQLSWFDSPHRTVDSTVAQPRALAMRIYVKIPLKLV